MIRNKIKKSLKKIISKRSKILVTKPFLPPIYKVLPYFFKIWSKGLLTNNGPLHNELEFKLANYLKVKNISLCSNGTLALLTAIKSLKIEGDVITTPYSFIATSNALIWNKLNPIFVDIEENSPNIDPLKIEASITKNTSAILAVHCYGIPCTVEKLELIAKKHKLKLIYDAAHAFGVELNNKSILNYGDLSILSFHATKVFNTFEGGAIISNDKKRIELINQLKNFGFESQVQINEIGINAKMSEINSAIGLAQIEYIDKVINKRKNLTELYHKNLNKFSGLKFFDIENIVQYNYSYLPVQVLESNKCSRDDLFEFLKNKNVFSRRYFYPLITNTIAYKEFKSSTKNSLLNAEKLAARILCLPLYPSLKKREVNRICKLIASKLN